MSGLPPKIFYRAGGDGFLWGSVCPAVIQGKYTEKVVKRLWGRAWGRGKWTQKRVAFQLTKEKSNIIRSQIETLTHSHDSTLSNSHKIPLKTHPPPQPRGAEKTASCHSHTQTSHMLNPCFCRAARISCGNR